MIHAIILIFCFFSSNQHNQDDQMRIADEFVQKFYINKTPNIEEVFSYTDFSKKEINKLSEKNQREMRKILLKAFEGVREEINPSTYRLVRKNQVDPLLLKQFSTSETESRIKDDNIIVLLNEGEVVSFFIFNEENQISSFFLDPWASSSTGKKVPLFLMDYSNLEN